MTSTVNELLTCFINCDAGPGEIVEAKLLLDVAESQQTRYESCFHIPTDSFSHSRNDKLIVRPITSHGVHFQAAVPSFVSVA